MIIIVLLLVLVVAGAVGAKMYADSSATEQVDERVTELEEMFAGATQEDFLAFNSGRSVPGSVAQQSADAEDFVSVDARAGRAVVRFQPKGWWAGFTERCIVVLVSDAGAEFLTPKTACVRVDPDAF
ncbi:MAG: hypothetical protein GY812_00940 [Actinomycetia bacterium]|nr:hypothetical protein [Actinomycetes bacterium]